MKSNIKYNHKFTCQILPLHRNKGRNGLHFGHFEGRKNALYLEILCCQNLISACDSLIPSANGVNVEYGYENPAVSSPN
jgi:hypothetical protein